MIILNRKILPEKILLILFLASSLNIFAQQNDFNIHGVWYVTDYNIQGISAMDTLMANEWLGKKAIIKEDLYFEYSKIKHYSSIFKNNYCKISINKDSVKTNDYFSEYKINPIDLGLNKSKIMIVHLGCKETPFDEIIVKSKNELIIIWDGVFFVLKRSTYPQQ